MIKKMVREGHSEACVVGKNLPMKSLGEYGSKWKIQQTQSL